MNVGVLPLSSIGGRNSWQTTSSLRWKSSPSSTPWKPTIETLVCGGQLFLLPQVWQAVSCEVGTVVSHQEA